MGIKEILENNGYPISEGPNYISTSAIFRGGDNKKAICIYPNDDLVIDFVTGERYSIKKLIGRIFGIENDEKIDEYIDKNQIIFESNNSKIDEKLIHGSKKLDKSFLDKLEPIHDYWVDRGISEEILVSLKGGLYNGRYYFPIYGNGDLLGLTSRDVTGKSKTRWFHKGQKANWVWPNKEQIEKKQEVILVEGVGCALSLMTCGIDNVLVTFGLECSYSIINFLLTLQRVSIKISLNSDERGKDASIKMFKKLNRYFDSYNIWIKPPEGAKDWNDLLISENGIEKIRKQFK